MSTSSTFNLGLVNNRLGVLSDQIANVATVITGTTNNSGHAISSGEYFIANGAKYKARATIDIEATWSDKSTSVSDHDLINALNSKIETLNPVRNQISFDSSFLNYLIMNNSIYTVKSGKVCIVAGYFYINSIPSNANTVISNTGLSLKAEIFVVFISQSGKTNRGKITTSGVLLTESVFQDTGWENFTAVCILE